MDVLRLEGIVEAIEAESKQPAPSHNNLARLTALFTKEMIGVLIQLDASIADQAHKRSDEPLPEEKRARKVKNASRSKLS